MIKTRLYDCCGAYHIYGFGDPLGYTRIDTNFGLLDVTNAEWLQLQSSHGNPRLSRWRPGCYATINNPGLMTCVLAGYQNMQWKRYLRKFGWVLASDNANNDNSRNDLYFWIKVCRTINNRRSIDYQAPGPTTSSWLLDGKPYTRSIRFKPDGTPYRVRGADGQLHSLTPTSGRTTEEVPAEALPLMRGNS